ncbi:MAG: tRNA (N(6)-L-threonylcarbamoyladenosine(37)-C(2))-methylthiotransferase MtaB [Chloroflexota bacterium]|nr:tRNA (N(6)-L-threonylcarbamoyladenosine(37)-C(2))-methylthiotransferase MtaB [Chloroflexota bacterium]
MKVHIKTLGCRLNQAESERIAQSFVLVGHEMTQDDADADLIVLNSCTVTGEAGRKSVRAARRHQGQKLVVTGCHSEVAPGAFRDADLIVANTAKENLVALTAERLATEGFALGADYREDASLQIYPLVLDHTRAFVKIQDGCNLSCSFCMTTIARGDSRSRALGAIVAEVQRLAAYGCQEVVLTGVHAGSYGREAGGKADLGVLIQRILEETAIPRLRLSSLEPWNFKTEWLELWPRWGDRLCRHLHMSLQSGSDSVLRRMRRAYRPESYADKVTAARAIIPEVAISTDIIVGFPGETEEEHRENLAFVEEMAFSSAHIFTFSPRPGTRAATMPRQVPNKVKKQRYREMQAITDRTAEQFRMMMQGTVQPVLWEQRGEDGIATGLTDTYLRVHSDDLRAARNRISTVRLGRVAGEGFEAEWLD